MSKGHKINYKLKRWVDLILCGLALPFLIPVCAILAFLIRLDSSGRAFYSQKRVGKNGQPFQIYKFRTMHKDADAQLEKYLKIVGPVNIVYQHLRAYSREVAAPWQSKEISVAPHLYEGV